MPVSSGDQVAFETRAGRRLDLERRRSLMEPPVLTDRNQYPSEEVIASHLGRNLPLWKAFFDFVHLEHPDFTERWRYYDDGKSWLMNVSRKKKTVFWLSLAGNTFRITAYFTEKARDDVRASGLSDELKERFLDPAGQARLRGITVTFGKKKDVEDAKRLVALKVGATAPTARLRRRVTSRV
jgi:hypothetical protein